VRFEIETPVPAELRLPGRPADKTLLRMKYADIVRVLALRTGVSMEDALKRFYESREYRLVSQGISDQHCMTPDYIVDDILRESDKSPVDRRC